MRDLLEIRELAVALLMQDLAGFGVTIIVFDLRLQRAQNVEAAAREVRIDKGVLQRNDQAVAAKRGDKPWQARSGQKNLVVSSGDREAQCGHVLKRLMIETIELFIAGADLQHRVEPVRYVFCMLSFLMLVGTTF
jgi:hypothetical protein